MREIIEDIRKKLNSNSHKDEQHIRFSLVGRICQALGWDIWDTEEFYAEYRVKQCKRVIEFAKYNPETGLGFELSE